MMIEMIEIGKTTEQMVIKSYFYIEQNSARVITYQEGAYGHLGQTVNLWSI